MKGSIRQRGETFTVYWFTSDPGTGKRQQHTKGGFKRKEPARPPKSDSAREFLNSVVGKVQTGEWRADRPLTVAQLVKDHWLPAQRERVRPTTWEQYRGAVDSWVLPYFAAVKVVALTPKEVTDWQARLRAERRLAARSIQMSTGFLKAATKYGLETGLIGRDPLVGVRRPRAESRTMTVWTPEQARTFLSATRSDRLYPAFALFLSRGLRRGEVAGLKWEHVDLDAGSLRVATTRVLMGDGRAVESGPKTKAGARTIDLDASVVSILRQHRRHQLQEQLKAGEAWESTGYVFTNELGTPYYPGYFSDAWERRISALGLPSIRLHDARHSCFSAMLKDGTAIKVVQELAGHSSATVTLDVYAHVLPGMAKEAGERHSAQLFG
jgi:integrase